MQVFGLLNSDGGVFPEYVRAFLMTAFTLVVQLALMNLSILVTINGHLIYAIAMDNVDDSTNGRQINIDKLMEEKGQIGKYFGMKYSKLLELLVEAENKKYINLNNNFGNRFIEFNGYDYAGLVDKYYVDKER